MTVIELTKKGTPAGFKKIKPGQYNGRGSSGTTGCDYEYKNHTISRKSSGWFVYFDETYVYRCDYAPLAKLWIDEMTSA